LTEKQNTYQNKYFPGTDLGAILKSQLHEISVNGSCDHLKFSSLSSLDKKESCFNVSFSGDPPDLPWSKNIAMVWGVQK